MKKPKEVLGKETIDYGIRSGYTKKVIEAMNQFGKEAYNQALDDAINNAETIQTSNAGNWLDAGVDPESILKLKK